MDGHRLAFRIHRNGSHACGDIAVRSAVIAGWTGRDPAEREKHISELEALGVTRPASTPAYYKIPVSRVTTRPLIEAKSSTSSGEVEFVLLNSGGELLLGVGSDHTDREVERYDVSVSKQIYDKPVAPDLWLFKEVEPHLEAIILRSWAWRNGERYLYQEGSLANILPPDEIVSGWGGLADSAIMFCGTVAALRGIHGSDRFEYEMEDPVLKRFIRYGYDVTDI